MAKPQTIVRDGSGTRTVSYTLPPGVFQYIESILVEVENGAAVDVNPELSVATTNGVVMADKRQSRAIPAGDSGRASWALRLDDEQAPAVDPFAEVRTLYLLRSGVNQAIANNTLTAITFPTVVYQNGNWSLGALPTALATVPTSGYYVVTGTVRWPIVAAGGTRRSVWITYNASLVAGNEYANMAGLLGDMDVAFVRRMSAGDTLALNVLQGSGGALNVGAAELSIARVWKV